MATIDFRTELNHLREQGADGTAAVKRLRSLGATDAEARHAVADYLIENRRRIEAERVTQQQIEENRTVSNLPETVTIRTADYLELVESDVTLIELQNAGGDNWDGYGEIDRDAIRRGVEAVKAKLATGNQPTEH